MTKILLLTFLVFIFGLSIIAQTVLTASKESVIEPSLTDKVDQLFIQWDKPDSPGCALAIIKDGQIVYKRGYGTANLELGVPISTATVFQVGSISKQFTAFSILLLAQQGKLSLDDDVRKYVAEVPVFGKMITLRHLIQHTSGLRDQNEMLEMAGWRNDDVNTEKDILEMVTRQRTLNHQPGEEWLYTNTGYTLLAAVVKRVSGQSLREFAEANIFKPLGMTSTQFNDDHRRIIRSLADGYLSQSDGGFIKWIAQDDHAGSDNLFTTVEDLARWDKNFYDRKIGGKALFEQMIIPGALNNGEKLSYAQGWFIENYKGLRVVRHDGARLGYRAEFVRFPEQNLAIACLCNARSANAELFTKRIADILLAEQLKSAATNQGALITNDPNIVKISEKELSSVTGLYLNPATDNIRRVYVKDGKLMFFRAAGNESELAPLSSNRFLMLGVRNRIEITFQSPRPRAPLQMLLTVDGGKPSIHETVKPASYLPPQLAEFIGEYYSPELDITYRMTASDDKLVLHTGNWGDFKLSARFADSFANMEEMGSLMFARDRRKHVTGFIIKSGKVRNLRFDKVK